MLCCCYFLLLICVDAKRLVIIDNDDKRPSIDEEGGGWGGVGSQRACFVLLVCAFVSFAVIVNAVQVCPHPLHKKDFSPRAPTNRKILFASSGHRCDLSQLLLVLVVGSALLHDDIQAFCKKVLCLPHQVLLSDNLIPIIFKVSLNELLSPAEVHRMSFTH